MSLIANGSEEVGKWIFIRNSSPLAHHQGGGRVEENRNKHNTVTGI